MPPRVILVGVLATASPFSSWGCALHQLATPGNWPQPQCCAHFIDCDDPSVNVIFEDLRVFITFICGGGFTVCGGFTQPGVICQRPDTLVLFNV